MGPQRRPVFPPPTHVFRESAEPPRPPVLPPCRIALTDTLYDLTVVGLQGLRRGANPHRRRRRCPLRKTFESGCTRCWTRRPSRPPSTRVLRTTWYAARSGTRRRTRRLARVSGVATLMTTERGVVRRARGTPRTIWAMTASTAQRRTWDPVGAGGNSSRRAYPPPTNSAAAPRVVIRVSSTNAWLKVRRARSR